MSEKKVSQELRKEYIRIKNELLRVLDDQKSWKPNGVPDETQETEILRLKEELHRISVQYLQFLKG